VARIAVDVQQRLQQALGLEFDGVVGGDHGTFN
jgi:hypothetical protein